MEVVLPLHCFWNRRKTMQLRPPSAFVAPLLLLFTLFYFSSLTVWAQSVPSGETQALIRFKQQITVDPTGYVESTWNEKSLDPKGCPKDWYGVNCSDQGNVIAVSLDNLALQGQVISGTLGSLYGLLNLSLSNNSFNGSLPDDFGGLAKITYINLSENRFVGFIPGSLVNLPALTNLSLAGNGFSGSIPSGLGMSIQNLDLSRNKLDGEIPDSLTQSRVLVALNLSSNNLEGTIPPKFTNLLLLETLDLHGNLLSGPIDTPLVGLNKTWYVDLSSNKFTGRLPWQLSSPGLNVVQYVNLSHNQLSDTFSTIGVVFTSSLRVLDVGYNQLYGLLPSFQYANALASLRLSDNLFSGSIPSTLYQTPSMLTELDLSANQLTGAIQEITSNFLTTINLSSNMLDGTLPSSLGQCRSLDLSNNKFHGDVSVMQSWGQVLQRLDLSHNQLTGTMGDLNPFQQLIYLNFSRNQLSGPLPDPLGSSQVLSVVDLSYNQFGGGIPRSLFYSSVTSLSLSHNQFSGSIPISDDSLPSSAPAPPLGSPSHLQVLAATTQLSPLLLLDLSSNHLTGSIPGKIGSISTLASLNLSNNSLSGRIPSQLGGLNSLQDLDLSMNQLSGPIPPLLPNSLTRLNVSRNNLSGVIPKGLARFPDSSFYPGNPTLARSGSSPQRSPSRSGGSNSKVKAGLIGGITAGAVVVFLIGVFIYFYRYPKSKHSTPASEFGVGQRGFEQYKTPVGHTLPEFEGDLERGSPNALPVVAAGKSVNSKKGKSSLTKSGSQEPKVGNDIVERDTGPTDNRRLPSGTEDVVSPEHPRVSKVSPEHPIGVKVLHSLEQLVGDVFFIDKTFSFSAEQLSRAPAEVLGRSNHGTSYKATLDDEHVLVVKWLKVELAKSRKEFGTEAKKFGNIKHQNILSMKGFYWGPHEHEKLILSEYLVGGSLADRLQERTDLSQPSLTWPQRLKVAVDVSSGLLYLHTKHRWAHGNIKASNILLTEEPNFEARLSDFSLHRLMTPAGIENQIVNSGALGYCAPELSAGKKSKPSYKSDVFSFGVILMELITGKSAGDIVSASTGIVDLPDWVKVVANEGHAIDCYDTALVGEDRDLEPPKGIEKMLALSLSCAAPQSSRPSMRVVHEGLAAINPD